ncbi:hypothetical protein AVEN_255798-1 [Araneus ventricosus]|uniref:Uncharacterized protein n=1 Tax=Araneus ventricosus TaxID=182803 RepID=A0A4Y2LYF0_ARAVE|nr:hypothetical protein AVEN_255798-1 [Araneus ventricosus]
MLVSANKTIQDSFFGDTAAYQVVMLGGGNIEMRVPFADEGHHLDISFQLLERGVGDQVYLKYNPLKHHESVTCRAARYTLMHGFGFHYHCIGGSLSDAGYEGSDNV